MNNRSSPLLTRKTIIHHYAPINTHYSPYLNHILTTYLNQISTTYISIHGWSPWLQAEIAQAASEAERLGQEAEQHSADAAAAAEEKGQATEVRSKAPGGAGAGEG